MTEDEAYKVHIQYTFNTFCKVVIRHAAIDIILKLRRRWEREVSLDYLMNEKFVQFAEPEQIEEYLLNACGQTAVLYHAELAAASGCRFIILDEATSAQDAANAHAIESRLLRDPALTVVTITHHMDPALAGAFDGILEL